MEKLYFSSSLHYLVNMGFSNEIIYDYLQNNDSDINSTNSFGETPLHYAVRNGNTRLIRLLLNEKADLYQMDEFGYTPYSLIMIKCRLNNHLFTTIKKYTRAFKKWIKVKTYVKITIVFNNLYKQTVHKLWMPGGQEYLKCERQFYNSIDYSTNLLFNSSKHVLHSKLL